jgi:energy-coupling factor transporter ATP-binding protein EcfA2
VYILKADISNLKSIRQLSWSVPLERAAGWHVVLGDNGSGKSSFLRAIALALVGKENAQALRQSWGNWVRNGAAKMEVHLELHQDSEFDRVLRSVDLVRRLMLKRKNLPALERVEKKLDLSVTFSVERLSGSEEGLSDPEPPIYQLEGKSPFLRASRSAGWFSAAYGPSRRFTGGDKEYDAIFQSNPRLARHLSLFDERVALTECLDWLRHLRFRQLEQGGSGEGGLLDSIKTFVNQEGFLPFGAQLKEVSSSHITFLDGNGCEIPVEEMSDGYRSILSMTFELIRQLSRKYTTRSLFLPSDPTKIFLPGVVLIDEVDAHLHPTWQRRIGLWFRQHFPNIQFIVTTHSPLVCQAADVGTVFRLPQPGTAEEPRMVTGHELDRLLYGDILDAYGTGIFGQGITRSQRSRDRLERLAHLNVKEINEGLSDEEMKEQEDLRAALPTAAHVLSADNAADS